MGSCAAPSTKYWHQFTIARSLQQCHPLSLRNSIGKSGSRLPNRLLTLALALASLK
ncbi:hypothetical protein ACZ87_03515 [Candidatus Erwinia dacicola]|uniref:Uncharacterized protein n=1 Tax=Candidatus Erwinia dacicola TaxID=252393 RepID=A0A328TPD9_9GAMM|nr:hypothetical protein ACZ87_03515 [Candidatus Erwinia dacicola]